MKSFLSSWQALGFLVVCLTICQMSPATVNSYAFAADQSDAVSSDKGKTDDVDVARNSNERQNTNAPPSSEETSNNPAVQAVAKAHKKKPPLQQGDLPNFHEVYPYLYRGGEPTEAGMTQLKQKGVSTIIDLRAQTEQEIEEAKIAKQMGFKYIDLPMTSEPPTRAQIHKVLSTVDDAKKKYLAGDQKSAVFVHCAHGSDRTGCMIGIWRVSRDGWDYDKAYAEMRKYYFTPKFVKLAAAVQKEAAHN